MTPPDFFFVCFAMKFLGNWCSTTFRVGENSFVPRAQCWAVPWAVLEPQGCSPQAVPGQGSHCLCCHSDPLPWNCQCKTCSLPWLKAEPTTAGWAPGQSNFVFSSKVHLHFWCISEQMPRWGSYKWPWRQSVTNLNSFSLCFIQIGNLVLEQ